MQTGADSANTEQRLDQMLSKLKEHDFRLTPQRLAVLKVLAASDGHPTVDLIYETVRNEFPTTSIATIYKTVHLLKQLDEVLELGFPDGSNRYDGKKPYPHPHVICTTCKKLWTRIWAVYKIWQKRSSKKPVLKCCIIGLIFSAPAVNVSRGSHKFFRFRILSILSNNDHLKLSVRPIKRTNH
jgi:Fe2+ or Zn2+ uptake regulation protein